MTALANSLAQAQAIWGALPPIYRERVLAENGGHILTPRGRMPLLPLWDASSRRSMKATTEHLQRENERMPQRPAHLLCIARQADGDMAVLMRHNGQSGGAWADDVYTCDAAFGALQWAAPSVYPLAPDRALIHWGITPFPPIGNVFESDTTLDHADMSLRHFPLLSVDLSKLNQGQGLAHVVLNWAQDVDQAAPAQCGQRTMRFAWDGSRYRLPAGARHRGKLDTLSRWWDVAARLHGDVPPVDLLAAIADHTTDALARSYMGDLVNHWLTRDRYLATGRLVQGGAWLQGDSAHERDLFKSLTLVPAPHLAQGHEAALNALLRPIVSVYAYDFMPGQPDRMHLQVNRGSAEAVLASAWS